MTKPKFRKRYKNFSPRAVLRVSEDFEFQGKKYKKDNIFDWAAEGVKRFYVKRLYSLKHLYHAYEDIKTRYPLRDLPDVAAKKHADKVEKEEALDADTAEDADDTAEKLPSKEEKAPTKIDEEAIPEKGIPEDAKAAKFTRKTPKK